MGALHRLPMLGRSLCLELYYNILWILFYCTYSLFGNNNFTTPFRNAKHGRITFYI